MREGTGGAELVRRTGVVQVQLAGRKYRARQERGSPGQPPNSTRPLAQENRHERTIQNPGLPDNRRVASGAHAGRRRGVVPRRGMV